MAPAAPAVISKPDHNLVEDTSYTAAGENTTAGQIGKAYRHEFPASTEPDKSAGRTADAALSSAAYAAASDALHSADGALDIDFHHPLEDLVPKWWFRWVLRRISAPHPRGTAPGANPPELPQPRQPAAGPAEVLALSSVHRPAARLGQPGERPRQNWSSTPRRCAGWSSRPAVVAEFGLTAPQRFSAPLFAVWNFTNRCNLPASTATRTASTPRLADELTPRGEARPGRPAGPGVHADAGLRRRRADDLPGPAAGAAAGAQHTDAHQRRHQRHDDDAASWPPSWPRRALRYVEISLDSVDPARHDAFRGVPGMWQRAVAGAKAVVGHAGPAAGHRHVRPPGQLRRGPRHDRASPSDLGAGCFAHFNFIPVGRGLKMVSGDITPAQREELLALLNEYDAGRADRRHLHRPAARAGVPGRRAGERTGAAACSHAGSGSGVKARVVAKYLGGCGAGRTYVCVEPNGNVTPCVYLPHRVMGNVRQRPLAGHLPQQRLLGHPQRPRPPAAPLRGVRVQATTAAAAAPRPTPTSASSTPATPAASSTRSTGTPWSPPAWPSRATHGRRGRFPAHPHPPRPGVAISEWRLPIAIPRPAPLPC